MVYGGKIQLIDALDQLSRSGMAGWQGGGITQGFEEMPPTEPEDVA